MQEILEQEQTAFASEYLARKGLSRQKKCLADCWEPVVEKEKESE